MKRSRRPKHGPIFFFLSKFQCAVPLLAPGQHLGRLMDACMHRALFFLLRAVKFLIFFPDGLVFEIGRSDSMMMAVLMAA